MAQYFGGPVRQAPMGLGNLMKQPIQKQMPAPRYGIGAPVNPVRQAALNQLGQSRKTPMLAKGTKSFKGGKAIVGEKGPEVVTLPKGSKVKPNAKAVATALRRKFAKK